MKELLEELVKSGIHVVFESGSATTIIKENSGTVNITAAGQKKVENQVRLLDLKVRQQIKRDASPKELLMPVRAAREAGVPLPFQNDVEFNQRYGTHVTQSAWSRHVNGPNGGGYDDRDLGTLIRQFDMNQ